MDDSWLDWFEELDVDQQELAYIISKYESAGWASDDRAIIECYQYLKELLNT